MNNDINMNKISLEEYQESNKNSGDLKSAKSFLFLLAVAIGIAVVFYLFSIVLKLFEIHNIAGYVGLFFSVILFVLFYLIPVLKIYKTKSFKTTVTSSNARQIQKYNKRLREELADEIIDSVSKVDGLNWYTDEHIKNLAIARHTKNDKDLKKVLSKIYSSDIKKTANKLILKNAVQVGISTAISQSDMIDALLIVIFEMKMIKDIIYLYGYRPSDTQMVKLMKGVLHNSLLAYGISITAEGIAQLVGGAMGSIPIVSVVVQSGIQGIANGTFAALLGKQTIKYLVKEYKLQDMLDNVELIDSVEEEENLFMAIANEVKKGTAKSKANKKMTPATTTP